MKKKLIAVLLVCVMTLSLVGCGGSSITVNVEDNSNLNSNTLGTDSFTNITNDLVYDPATRIVYIKSITYGIGYYVYTAYYAPNGLPYRYNPETNTFEEINFDNE